MQRYEALALVATLQAAFPAGTAGRETVELYAHQFEQYDGDQGARAVNTLIQTRHEAFLPTWAEIHDVLVVERPRFKALPEPEGVPPTPEQQAAIAALVIRGERRTAELQLGTKQ